MKCAKKRLKHNHSLTSLGTMTLWKSYSPYSMDLRIFYLAFLSFILVWNRFLAASISFSKSFISFCFLASIS